MTSHLSSGLLTAPLGSIHDGMPKDLPRPYAPTHSRRLSRGLSGLRTPGSMMKVTKPSSASTSPQSSLLQARRRTIVNDNYHARIPLQHPIETTFLPTPGADMAFRAVDEPTKRAPRPMSWHPSPQQSSFLKGPSPDSLTQYPFPSYQEHDIYTNYQQLPPTPAAYSNYSSPVSASAFSPLSLPYSNVDYQHYASPPAWTAAMVSEQAPVSNGSTEPIPSQLPRLSGSTGSSSDWDLFAERGFDRSVPPTPITLPLAQPEAKLPVDEAIPFESLEDDVSDGEVLYGMGLYDPPRPPVDYHRSTVLSLLGSVDTAEPRGKGLKLEDAWEPPASDDEDAEDEEDDDNGDSDE